MAIEKNKSNIFGISWGRFSASEAENRVPMCKCTAYHHLWQHDAEAEVAIMYGEWCKLIKKQLPTKQDEYVKTIDYIGTDGANYRFIFYQLTIDTDVLISQFKKNAEGNWQSIRIDPYQCLDNKA